MIVTFGNQDTWTGENWSMTINLGVLCSQEGVKIEVPTSPDSKNYVKVLAYPTEKVRKLFKLMIRTMSEDELDNVQIYLTCWTTKWHEVFKKLREKGR